MRDRWNRSGGMALVGAGLALVLAGGGCGKSHKPTMATSMEPEPEPSQITADVLQVEPASTEAPYATAVVSFRNPGPEMVRVLRFQLAWPGGKMTVATDPFEVPGSGTTERRVRIDQSAGDVDALVTRSPEARVKILAASGVQ
jgi:hypothetical protein